MKLNAVFVFLLCCTLAAGQVRTFDLTSYEELPGWEIKKTDDVITFTKDGGSNGFCIVNLYKSIDASGDSKKNFDLSWETLVHKNTRAASPVMQPLSSDNGWETQTGSSPFEKDDVKGAAILLSATQMNKLVNILVLLSGNDYIIEMEKLLAAISLHSPDHSQQPGQKRTSQPQAIQADEKPAVWMNMQYNPASPNTIEFNNNSMGKIKPKFYVIYPNGDYYPHFPTEGLANFSNKNKLTDSWGTFMLQGNKGSFKSRYEDFKVEKLSATTMKKQGYTFKFYKCAEVDGLTLEGGWSYIPNWRKDPYYSQPGCRQVIWFKKDGTFDDRGIFVSNCLQPHQSPLNAPGKGTYVISNFTIVLTYSDGRIVHKAFTGTADKNPVVENEVIYIGTNPFYKN